MKVRILGFRNDDLGITQFVIGATLFIMPSCLKYLELLRLILPRYKGACIVDADIGSQ